MRVALVQQDDIVANVIVVGDDYSAPEGLSVVAVTEGVAVAPGWSYDGTDFTAPPEPDPQPEPGPSVEERLAAQEALIDALMLESLMVTAAFQDQLDALILESLG